jgi:hypothetical protein
MFYRLVEAIGGLPIAQVLTAHWRSRSVTPPACMDRSDGGVLR